MIFLSGLAFFGLVQGPAECATIHDHDSRMMCFAEATGSETWCESIHDHDLRVRCRVRMSK